MMDISSSNSFLHKIHKVKPQFAISVALHLENQELVLDEVDDFIATGKA